MAPSFVLTGAGAASAASPVRSTPTQAIEKALHSFRVGAPAQVIHLSTPNVFNGQVTSANWTGYIADDSLGNTYKAVSGQWVQPAVTCISNTDVEAALFWVGIDGYQSSTVEQAGTMAVCNNGSVSYFDWWEMAPAPQVVMAPILAGDSITSSVKYSSGAYTLNVTDATHPTQSFTTTQACSATCTNTSAEWIAERPLESGTTQLAVLPDFRRWNLTHASVKSFGTRGVISTFGYDDAIMENSSSQVLALVGALGTTGNSFKAFWRQSA